MPLFFWVDYGKGKTYNETNRGNRGKIIEVPASPFGLCRADIRTSASSPGDGRYFAKGREVVMMKTEILKKNKGFTLVELLVVISIIALLMAILIPALSKARRTAKRVICIGNLKQMALGWMLYAENNDGKLVNGGQAPAPTTAADIAKTEPYWCSSFPTDGTASYDWASGLTYEQAVEKMMGGALFRYIKNVKMYRCQEAPKTTHRTFVMCTSMNAAWATGDQTCYPTSKVAKRLGQIRKSKERAVFF